MEDTADKAFESLTILKMCLKRINWFSPGVPGHEMLQNTDRCASLGHWSPIIAKKVVFDTITEKTLFKACRSGHMGAIRTIITYYGIDVNEVDEYGWGALHIAAMHKHRNAVSMLLKLGAKDTPLTTGIRISVLCPEMFQKKGKAWKFDGDRIDGTRHLIKLTFGSSDATWNEVAIEIMKMVNTYGKDVLTQFYDRVLNPNSFTMSSVLFNSIRSKWSWLTRLCLEIGVDPNIKFLGKMTPLHVACENDNSECARALLEYGAIVDPTTRFGDTPLFAACEYSDEPTCARLLLENNANANAVNLFGETPLFWGSRAGKLEYVRLLLEHGAVTTSTNTIGRCTCPRL